MNSMKRQKDMTPKMSPQVSMSNMLLGNSGEIAPERMTRLSQRRNDAQLCLCLVVKVKSDAVKSSMKTCKTF